MGHSESKPQDDQVQYDITIYTGDKKKAGKSDSHTFVILYGDKGTSGAIQLHHERRDDFTKGHVDTHPVYSDDLGQLWKLELWKNDKSDKPGHWYVDKVVVQAKKSLDKKRDLKASYDSKREVSLTEDPEGKSSKFNTKKITKPSRSASDAQPLYKSTPTPTVSPLSLSDSAPSQSSTRDTWVFPCYRWIDEHEELFEGSTCLPQYETFRDRDTQRKDEIEKKRGIYQWKSAPGIPTYLRCTFDTLPIDERWNEEKLNDFMGSRMRAGANFGLEKVLDVFHKWKDFDDYKDLFTVLPVPELRKTWKQDEVFGKLRIYGVNPCNIQRVLAWPIKNFKIKKRLLKPFLRPNTTVKDEVKASRFYLIDFSWYNEFDKPEYLKEGRFISSPMLLLYLDAQDKLMPVAIQLRTTDPYDPEKCPIFTPADPEPEWLLAKIFYANSETLHHQLQAHLLATHLITEPMVIAMHRHMASCHPIYKLMLPHFKYQLAINVRARELLINEGGPIDLMMPLKMEKLMAVVAKGFQNWNFKQANPAAILKNNNISDDPKDLPGYYYRDDGLKIWAAIQSFVKDVVNGFYGKDEDVHLDFELQNWAQEVVGLGFHGDAHGFPSRIETKEELAFTLATIIWIVSAQHAVLNFVQYDCYGWVPSHPASLTIAPLGHPDSKWVRGKLTFDDIMHGLPNKDLCAKQIALSYILSQYSSEDHMLGSYPETYFTEEVFSTALASYNEKLAAIGKIIDERGDWDHLHPKKIPNATAV